MTRAEKSSRFSITAPRFSGQSNGHVENRHQLAASGFIEQRFQV
jgi:hypothetical protein